MPTLKWPRTRKSSDNTANLLYLLSLTEGTPDLSHLLSWCSQRSEACWNRQFPWPQCSSSNSYPFSHSCSFNPLLQCSSSNSTSLTLSLSYSCPFKSNPLSQCSSKSYSLSHSCSFNPLLQCSSSNFLSLTLSLSYSYSFNSSLLSQCSSSNSYPLSHSCSFNPLSQCSSSNSYPLSYSCSFNSNPLSQCSSSNSYPVSYSCCFNSDRCAVVIIQSKGSGPCQYWQQSFAIFWIGLFVLIKAANDPQPRPSTVLNKRCKCKQKHCKHKQ